MGDHISVEWSFNYPIQNNVEVYRTLHSLEI